MAAAAQAARRGAFAAVEGLSSPSGFARLADTAKTRAAASMRRLADSAPPGSGGRVPLAAYVEAVEEVADATRAARAPAALCQHVHPEREWREAAGEAARDLAVFEVAAPDGCYAVVSDAEVEALPPRARLLFDAHVGHAPRGDEDLRLLREEARLEEEFEARLRGGAAAEASRARARSASEPDPLERERLWREAAAAVPENLDTLAALLRARHGLALSRGHASYAHMALAREAAGSPEEVRRLTAGLVGRCGGVADAELRAIAAAAGAGDGPARQWDLGYHAPRLRASLVGHGAGDVAAHLPLDACLEGLRGVVAALFGCELRESEAGGEWADGVVRLDVCEGADRGGGLIGAAFLDLWARPGKGPGPATLDAVSPPGGAGDGRALPTVAVCAAFRPPVLTYGQLRTLFHEFGHVLAALMSRAPRSSLHPLRGGATDLAEVSAMLFEYFARDPRVLASFARHHQTGEPMPDSMLEGLSRSRRAFAALETRCVAVEAAADQELHGPGAGEATPEWIVGALRRSAAELFPALPHEEGAHWPAQQFHLVAKGAHHYSYLYARVAAAHAWRRLFDAGDSVSREPGEHLRQSLFEPGASLPPRQLLDALLRGESPDPAHFSDELGESPFAKK